MSPTRLLLEGPDLQALLEQIRSTYGPDATIVEAEKIRRGGVAGFFAHERFHVQVEVPESYAALAETEGDGSSVRSVMDLVDKLNDDEEALQADLTAAASSLRSGGLGSELAPSQPVAIPLEASALFSSPAAAAGGEAGFGAATAQAAYAHTARSPSTLALLDDEPPTPTRPPVSTQSATFADILARLERSIGESPAEHPAARAATSSVPPVTRPLTAVPDGGGFEPLAGHASLAQPATLRRAPEQRPEPRPVPTGPEMAARAIAKGVPAQLLTGVEDPAEVYRRVFSWIQSRPVAPMIVSKPGQVVVVVGEMQAALGVADDLAAYLRVGPSEVNLVVSPRTRPDVSATRLLSMVSAGRLMTDVSDIAVRRSQWQYHPASTIVVVEAGMPPADPTWLREAVAALAPTFTWAVAQASTKVGDVTAWTEKIGQVDALALVNLAATADPAASLATPIAVGMLDGRRASVTRWMAMLTHDEES